MQPKRSGGPLRVVIIDDEENIRRTTAVVLEAMGHETAEVPNRAMALKHVASEPADLAFLDLRLGRESGLDLLPELLSIDPELQIIVFTAYASIETAVEAMRRGAADYLAKPFTPEHIRQAVARIIEARKSGVAELESRLSTISPPLDLHSNEPRMQKIFELAAKAAGTPASILLLGESGTGKTVLARAIHSRSPQKDKAFVTIHCPSLSRELLESELFGHVKGAFTGATTDKTGKVALAEGGTLFLDEIGELPMEIQPKLLRLLQEREYERVGEARTRQANVRVISATNRDLEKAIPAGRFREDLYYRLNVLSLQMPPLRDRPSDLLHLAESYLQFFAEQCGKALIGFSSDAQQALCRYAWPGNLRELRNVVERAVILAATPEIDLSDLPEKMAHLPCPPAAEGIQVGAKASLEALEAEHITQVIQQSATMEEAARILGIDPATLYRKRKRLPGLSTRMRDSATDEA